jgi:PAS domain S-box-containing protein
MLAGLMLLEVLSITLFAFFMIRQQGNQISQRAQERLANQTAFLALQAREALLQNQPDWTSRSVKMMGSAPDVSMAKITGPDGVVLFASDSQPAEPDLDSFERAQLPLIRREESSLFSLGGDRWECAKGFYIDGRLRGIVWVEADRAWNHEPLDILLRGTAIFGVIWILASAMLVLLMARTISSPLAILHRGTRALMNSPETGGSFPLAVVVHNEFGDLIEAFNRMVASLAEQRAGLNDTLSLLDSMLANAPIGLAFFDRQCRFVRVNQVFADLTGNPLSHHLGRTLRELLPQPVALEFEKTVKRVFDQEEPIRDLELSGAIENTKRTWTWLASAYPVRTTPQQVRWVGVIVLDTSDRKRSEEALRRTEKLAATGRLAASIAHEINNPLEAITNILFLLHNFCNLQDPALNYVKLAEHEAQRIAEITQQTLRFYRQSTLPTRANMAELIDSVLTLFQGRLNGLNIQLHREYDAELALFCFAGEIRQVFANLIGNAIDAISDGGRILIRARRSRNWKCPHQDGVRFLVADSGVGMENAVRERIFEAFFTTKEQTGTGLGLWVSYEIVVKHQGTVRARSRMASPGCPSGTVFELFIPDFPDQAGTNKNPATEELM